MVTCRTPQNQNSKEPTKTKTSSMRGESRRRLPKEHKKRILKQGRTTQAHSHSSLFVPLSLLYFAHHLLSCVMFALPCSPILALASSVCGGLSSERGITLKYMSRKGKIKTNIIGKIKTKKQRGKWKKLALLSEYKAVGGKGVLRSSRRDGCNTVTPLCFGQKEETKEKKEAVGGLKDQCFRY